MTGRMNRKTLVNMARVRRAKAMVGAPVEPYCGEAGRQSRNGTAPKANSTTHFAELLAIVAVCDWDIPQRGGERSAKDEEEEAQAESE
jgi:hypothetical protein